MNNRLAKIILLLTSWLTLLVGVSRSQTDSAPATAVVEDDDSIITLNPFAVRSDRDMGYRKNSSITTSRIGVSTYESPQAVQIVSGELLHDFSIGSMRQAFNYTASVVSNSEEALQLGTYKLRGFDLPQYYNGVSIISASGPGYTSTDNVERIEIAKGPVGLFYGNSTPNGVANTITKKPQHINRTVLETEGGTLGYYRAMIDTQAVVSKDLGLAYRLVAAGSGSERRVGTKTSYAMLAGSVSFRPNDKIRVEMEYSHNSFKQPYAAFVWNFMTNPLYYQQVANPDQTMLNYIKAKFGAADDAAARAIIVNRWGANSGKGGTTGIQVNWPADYFGAYGKVIYPLSGSTVNWDMISPYGNEFSAVTPDSNLDGHTTVGEASVTYTPTESTAINYHWVRLLTFQNLFRSIFVPNPGPLDSQGRIQSLGIAVTQANVREGYADTQQLDFSQQINFGGIKSKLIGGFEMRRANTRNGGATIDNSKAPTRTTPDGVVTTGLATQQNFYPFTQAYVPIPSLIAGAINQTAGTPTELSDWYATYRGALLNDKLNLVAGLRSTKQKTEKQITKGDSVRTKSFGAIGQIYPGLYAFGNYSTTFQFPTAYTASYSNTGLPIPGEGEVLKPETGKGFDVGLKSALFDDKLSGSISFFSVERTGVPTIDLVKHLTDPRNTDTNPNNDVRFQVNGGRQRSRGVDADFSWTPSRSLQFLASIVWTHEAQILSDPNVDTKNINYSFNNAQLYDKEFNHRLSKSPEFAWNVVGKYSFTTGGLQGTYVGGGVRYTGLYSVSDNANIDIYTEERTIMDIFVGTRIKYFGVPGSIQLNLSNVTNAIDDLHPEEGFAARVRLTMEF